MGKSSVVGCSGAWKPVSYSTKVPSESAPRGLVLTSASTVAWLFSVVPRFSWPSAPWATAASSPPTLTVQRSVALHTW